jgi:hypothetical protein
MFAEVRSNRVTIVGLLHQTRQTIHHDKLIFGHLQIGSALQCSISSNER